jgi:hypothetical protein
VATLVLGKRGGSSHSIAQRARIVLLAADGLSNMEVADKIGCNQAGGLDDDRGGHRVVDPADVGERPGGIEGV